MKLLIVSHTPHYMENGQLVGWGPTVREIDQLTRLFESVIHLAVLYNEPAPPSSLGYTAKNIRFMSVRPAGGDTWAAKLGILAAYPGYWRKLQAAISELGDSDCVHVRCPANLSFLAISWLAVTHKPQYRWVKYAGNWQPTIDEPFFYRLQRRLLVCNIHHGIVTVNGKWHNQRPHVLSFNNPSMHLNEIQTATAQVLGKVIDRPLQLLFVGALNEAKGASRVLQIADMLRANGSVFRLHLIGDGPDRPQYAAWVMDHQLETMVQFHGWVRRNELAPFYEQAHLNILPSASEGWPKVLSEGMAYGVVPIAGAVSSIPQTLDEFHTGCALDPRDLDAFVRAIGDYEHCPEKWKEESLAGIAAARHFTYENYLLQVKSIFQEKWGICL